MLIVLLKRSKSTISCREIYRIFIIDLLIGILRPGDKSGNTVYDIKTFECEIILKMCAKIFVVCDHGNSKISLITYKINKIF